MSPCQKTALRLDRRTLVRGAAWSVPTVVVATAAPAMAITPSLCPAGKFTMDWSYGAGVFSSTPAAIGPNGFSTWTWKPTVLQGVGPSNSFTVTATSVYSNAVGTPVSLEMRSQTGGSSASGVTVGQNASSTTNSACFTFSFSQTLHNVKFSVGDIDFVGHEQAWISPTPTTATIFSPANVTGSGTAAVPWAGTGGDLNIQTDHNSAVDLTYTTLTSFTLCLHNITTGWGSNITVSSMIFDCPTWV